MIERERFTVRVSDRVRDWFNHLQRRIDEGGAEARKEAGGKHPPLGRIISRAVEQLPEFKQWENEREEQR